MVQILSFSLLAAGVALMLIAAVGVVRFPDLFMRIHCSAKSPSLGVGLIMLGAALYFDDITVSSKAAVIVMFIMVTSPVGAHVLARAAYFAGVPLWRETLSDELRDHYDLKTHELGRPGAAPARRPRPPQPDL